MIEIRIPISPRTGFAVVKWAIVVAVGASSWMFSHWIAVGFLAGIVALGAAILEGEETRS